MSRIGTQQIIMPEGVTVEKTEEVLVVNGPKGKLEMKIPAEIDVKLQDGTILVIRKDDNKTSRALHGLVRSVLNNMVLGVSQGWVKDLELVGVGFRAQGGGDKVTLSVGFSHPVEVQAPEGVSFQVSDNTKIKVSGIDKQSVGQVAANIRKIRPPDAYKGKGIRYEGEHIRKKPGKAAAGAGAAK